MKAGDGVPAGQWTNQQNPKLMWHLEVENSNEYLLNMSIVNNVT